jgi:hypothetical protein
MIVKLGAKDPRFELLLVGQGFPTDWDRQAMAVDLDWTLGSILPEADVAIYLDLDNQALGLTAQPPGIQVDQSKLTQYLQAAELPVRTLKKPLERWGTDGRSPLVGALVGLLLGAPQGTTPPKADAYDRDRLGGLPPFAAVQLGAEPVVPVSRTYGSLWQKVFLRAVAQLHYGLLDEYELPGTDFEKPPAEWQGGGFNNVVFITATQKAALSGTSPPNTRTLLGDAVRDWPLRNDDERPFFPHVGAASQVSTAGPRSTRLNSDPEDYLFLYEGAAEYRTLALRGAADCLLHRVPGSSSLPVQDEVGLCCVCRHLVAGPLDERQRRTLVRPTLLKDQRVEFDRMPWPGTAQSLSGSAVVTFSATEAPTSGKPRWKATIKVSATSGLMLEDVELHDRPDDPFVNSPKVFKRLAFQDLAVKLAGQAAQPLSVASALAATGDLAPTLLIQRDAGDFEAQFGVKLTLRWDLASGWRVEAAMAVVLKRARNSVDPGKGVFGCKVYPQIALRCLRRPGHTGALPAVESLDGTVLLHLDNAVDAADHQAMIDAGMSHGARMTGAIDASLFADGNDVHTDAEYTEVSLPGAFLFGPIAQLGAAATETLKWKAFRRIAAVQKFSSAIVAANATNNYQAHAAGLAAILPHWSWLFDYTDPLTVAQPGATANFVGAWAADETTPGARKARDGTEVLLDWPAGSDFNDLKGLSPVPQPALRHRRYARQGVWDNIHVTAPMGTDAKGRLIVSAPVCADKCFHLHWRWGVDGVKAPTIFVQEPELYYGWAEKGGTRSHAEAGAPLIPPNQHLEVKLERVSDAELKILYATKARSPVPGHWQVSLEQGTAFAFNYMGLPGLFFRGLVLAVLGRVEPAADAATRRKVFMEIYARLRWFDPDEDGAARNNVQQIPSWSDLPQAKRDELRNA